MSEKDEQALPCNGEHLSPKHYHVVIIGGGLVGLSAAVALSHLSKRDHARSLNVAVVEAFSPPTEEYSADDDPRTTALSYGTRMIYESLGLWENLKPYAQAIQRIHVSDRGAMGMTHLASSDYQLPSLGYVVPNKQLLHVLTTVVESLPDVTFYRPASVEALDMLQEFPLLTLTQGERTHTLSTELVILADGGRSPLMKQMGFEPHITEYGHTGILATVTHSQRHDATAFERFTDEGPMAMLPIASGHQCKSAMIWTMPAPLAEERMQLPDDYFLQELHTRFGYRLGAFKQVGKRLSFPLALKIVAEPACQGGVLLGNSAHSLHPVAGQGYNLALRDTMVLTSLLTETPSHCSLGNLVLLQDYLQRQHADQAAAITFSDRLVHTFSTHHRLLQSGRSSALMILNSLLPAKRWFGYKAMGLGGYGQ